MPRQAVARLAVWAVVTPAGLAAKTSAGLAPAAGFVPASASAAHAPGPATPSTRRPRACWNEISALRVPPLKFPSTLSGSKPRSARQIFRRNFEDQFVVDLQQHFATAVFRHLRRRWMLSMASFIRSAALPWMTVLIAVRSGKVRCRAAGSPGCVVGNVAHALDRAATAEDRRHVALLAALDQHFAQKLLDARIAVEVGVDELRRLFLFDVEHLRQPERTLAVDHAKIDRLGHAPHAPRSPPPAARRTPGWPRGRECLHRAQRPPHSVSSPEKWASTRSSICE